MCRERTVCGFDGPTVGQLTNLAAAYVYHRFDGKGHTHHKLDAAPCRSEIRNLGVFVQIVSDTVADVPSYNAEAFGFNTTLYSVTDVADAVRFTALLKTAEEALLGGLDQVRRFIADASDGEGSRHIRVKSLVERTRIYLYDVTLEKYSLL